MCNSPIIAKLKELEVRQNHYGMVYWDEIQAIIDEFEVKE